MIKERKIDANEEKIDFHTKIYKDDYRMIKTLALKYGNIQKVIEKALKLVRSKEAITSANISDKIRKDKMDNYLLASIMHQEFQMVYVGRRTFLSYIKKIPQTPIEENNALELIEWFYNDEKPISELSLEEILIAIRNLWIAGNYFKNISIKPLNTDGFKIVFYHDFNDTTYGNYWIRYFKYIFTHDPLKFKIEQVKIRPQSFYFDIYEN
ncbi:MAG: hypothetical protein ACTSWL_04555 [Promethearchaeota archaeon]